MPMVLCFSFVWLHDPVFGVPSSKEWTGSLGEGKVLGGSRKFQKSFLSRYVRKLVYGAELPLTVGQDVVHAALCSAPIIAALDSAFAELVRNRYHHLKK